MNEIHGLDPSIAEKVADVATASESVWDWHESADGTIDVLLIEADKLKQAQMMISIGLAGGEGRCLDFAKMEGKWRLVGVSRWIG